MDNDEEVRNLTLIEKLYKITSRTSENLLTPLCPGTKYGCNIIMNPDEMQAHAETCKYLQNCAGLNLYECKWKGTTIEKLRHFLACHKASIFQSDEHIVYIDVTVSKRFSCLLTKDNFIVKLDMICQPELDLIKFVMFNMFNDKSYEYTAKFLIRIGGMIGIRANVVPAGHTLDPYVQKLKISNLWSGTRGGTEIRCQFVFFLTDPNQEVYDTPYLHPYFDC